MEPVYIKGFNEKYLIFPDGEVFDTFKQRSIKIGNSHGYPTVCLNWKIYLLHRLLYENFIGELIEGLVVHHVDLDKLNYSLDNLYQVTQRYNMNTENTKKNTVSIYTGVVWNKSKNKWQSQIMINGKNTYLGIFEDEYSAHILYQKTLQTQI